MNWTSALYAAGGVGALLLWAGGAAWWFDYAIRKDIHGGWVLAGFFVYLAVPVGLMWGSWS